MTKLPSANNSSTAKELYKSRAIYDDLYEQDNSQFDFWYDLPFYGKVDKLGRVVYPKESFLEQVSKDSDDNVSLCFNFVSQAFKKMRLHYETLYLDGYIDTSSEFFDRTIQPVKGWTSSTRAYSEHQQAFYEILFDEQLLPLSESDIITTFDDFVEILKQQIKKNRSPFTRVGFNESNDLSINSNGLSLEIFEGEYGNDEQAFQFVGDPNFELFEELCKKYGFRIDRNSPWRITFNLLSDNAEPFIREQITEDKEITIKLEEMFEIFYERLNIVDYFEEFYNYMFASYITFIQAFPIYKVNKAEGTSSLKDCFSSYKDRVLPPARDLFNDQQNLSLLELFYDVRSLEAGLSVSDRRRSFHLKNASSIYRFNRDNKKKAIQKSLDYILYNLGTVTYRSPTVNENNLTRADDIGIISPQDQFNRRVGEDSSYLNDFSDS
tara:strand:+ start:88 stop:1398 length:1311 start_codon:yes stop_codon:yes gene_type:complete